MKVNAQVLCIPPYISCPWSQISSLCVEAPGGQRRLVIYMQNGSRVEIPGLSPTLIDMVFTAHGEFLDQSGPLGKEISSKGSSVGADFSMNIMPLPPGMNSFVDMMQHSPEHKDMPDIPTEILNKVISVIRSVAPDELKHMSKAEPHCNCFHCQLSRKIDSISDDELPLDIDSPVTDEELTFRTWDIKSESEDVYTVTNPLDETETYRVHLKNPIGCTCGQKNCEHIEAVLRSYK